MSGISRRQYLALGISVASVAAITACGNDGADPAGSSTRTGMVIGIGQEPTTLNPAVTTDQATGAVAGMIFDGLVSWDADGEIQPALAESWTTSDDGLDYTFTLRDAVTWHDGEPLTAEDVVFTFTEVLGIYHPRASALITSIGLQVRADDDRTVRFTLESPYGPLLQRLGAVEAPILPAHLYAGSSDIASDPLNLEPIGTGPFTFQSWEAGTGIRLAANESYWADELPVLATVDVRIIPDPSNLTVALQQGEIDLISPSWLATADIALLDNDEALARIERPTLVSIQELALNLDNPALADVRVRRAIATALDRQTIIDLGSDGIGMPCDSALGSAFDWTYDSDDSYSALYAGGADAARTLLEEVGGEPLTLRLAYDNSTGSTSQIAQVIADQLEEIGISVQLVELETQVLVDQVFTNRDFDMVLLFLTSSGDPAIGYHRIYASNETTNQYINPTGYANAEVDQLFAQATALSDRDRRGEYYRQASAILNRDLPSIALFETTPIVFTDADLDGVWTYFDSRLGVERYQWI